MCFMSHMFSHLTMPPFSPIVNEIMSNILLNNNHNSQATKAYKRGKDDYLIINCTNTLLIRSKHGKNIKIKDK